MSKLISWNPLGEVEIVSFPDKSEADTNLHRTSLKKKTWGYEYTDSDYDRFYIELIKEPGEDIFYVHVTYYKIDTPLELGTISLKEDRDILLTSRLHSLANRDEFTLAFDAVDALFEGIAHVDALFEEIVHVESD